MESEKTRSRTVILSDRNIEFVSSMAEKKGVSWSKALREIINAAETQVIA